jgi:hypothetical protein
MGLTEAQKENLRAWAAKIASSKYMTWGQHPQTVFSTLVQAMQRHNDIIGVQWIAVYDVIGWGEEERVLSNVFHRGWGYNDNTQKLRNQLLNTSPTLKSLKDYESWL